MLVAFQFGFDGLERAMALGMAKCSSKKKEHNFAVTAFRVVEEATTEAMPEEERPELPAEAPEDKNPHAVAMGRLGPRSSHQSSDGR